MLPEPQGPQLAPDRVGQPAIEFADLPFPNHGREAQGEVAREFYHIALNPDPSWTAVPRVEAERLWWEAFEHEFGLEGAAYLKVRHTKHGRGHTHRVYDLTACRGAGLVSLSHDYARRQAISARVAHAVGAPCPPIAHPRRVIGILERRGHHAAARHVRDTWRAEERRSRGPESPAAPVAAEAAPRIVAPITPRERMQEARTGVRKGDVAAAVLAAWHASDTGAAFVAALRDRGLRIAEGDKAAAPVVLDETGNAHALARLLRAESKRTGGARIDAAEVRARLAGVALAPVLVARGQPVPAQAGPLQAAPAFIEAVPAMCETILPEEAAAAPMDPARLLADLRAAMEAMRGAQAVAEAADRQTEERAARAAQAQDAPAAPREPIRVPPTQPPASPVRTASDLRAAAARERERRREASLIAEGRAMAERLVAEVLARASNAARIAALEARVEAATARFAQMKDQHSVARRAAQAAQAEVVRAAAEAVRRLKAEKLRPLIEAQERAQAAFDAANRDLAQHQTTGPMRRITRAWRTEDTRLRQIVATARVMLDEAKRALSRMRSWLTGEGGRRGRAAAEEAAREAIRREVLAPAVAKRGEARQALRQAEEERRITFRELWAAKTELGIETGEIAPRPDRKPRPAAPAPPPTDPKAPSPAWR